MREPPAARRRLTRAAALATLVATACSGDGATPATPATTATTAPPTLAVDTMPAVTDTTPPDIGPLTVEPPGPTFAPRALVAPDGARPWILVGTGRADAGEPARLTMFSSPDGRSWSQLDAGAADHTAGAAAYGRADGSLVIAGAVDDAGGSRPAVWELRDGVLAAPQVVDVVLGAATAVAPDDRGEPVLLLASPDGPAVASKVDGAWSTVLLPVGGDATGIGVSALSTVVTGTSIWRSTDGARSFEVTTAAPVLGAVLGVPGGFVAASCATGGPVLSPDGRVWTDLAAVHPRGVAPVAGGGCGTLALDEDGGVWLASAVREPVVYRVRDQVVDRLGVPPRPPGTIFDGQPLVAAAAGAVVVAVPQPGGVATSTARSVTLPTDLELDSAMIATSGATPGHAAPVAVVPLDDRGVAAGVAIHPVVVDATDGSYRWTTTLEAGAVDTAGHLVPRARPAPVGPDGSLGGIVRLAAGEVSLATVPDPDVPPGAPGPVGDVVLSRRDGESWSPREVVVGGPGRQAVDAVVAAGGVAVGVGEEVTVDGAGATVTTPLVVVSDGTTTRSLAVDAAVRSLGAACPGPAGTVVALGTDATGVTLVATIDVAADTVTVAPAPAGVALSACAGDGTDLLVAGDRALFTSADGVGFEPLAALGPGDRVGAVAAGPAGFAVAGTTVTGDGFLLAGPRATQVVAVDAPALGGVGAHEPTGLIVRDGTVVVLGLADGAPTSWPIPVP